MNTTERKDETTEAELRYMTITNWRLSRLLSRARVHGLTALPHPQVGRCILVVADPENYSGRTYLVLYPHGRGNRSSLSVSVSGPGRWDEISIRDAGSLMASGELG